MCLIRENHFKKVGIIFEKNTLLISKNILKLSRRIKNRHTQCILYPTDIRQDMIKVDHNLDLIISYGNRYIHDIAKQSNNNHAHIYCIETIAGHMSSYGTGIVWKNNQTAWKALIPNMVFNSCHKVHKWGINDLLYYLHNIPLALEACFNLEKKDDFINACAFSGILQTLKYYKQCKEAHSHHALRRIYRNLAQADILTKNAYNNAPLSDETKKIAENIQHYHQFEVVIAYESLDMVNTQLRRHYDQITKIFKYLGSSIEAFKDDFEKMYYEFIKHPKRWETCGDILGKKITEIMGLNKQTRRVL